MQIQRNLNGRRMKRLLSSVQLMAEKEGNILRLLWKNQVQFTLVKEGNIKF